MWVILNITRQPTYLSICLSVFLSVRLFVCLSVQCLIALGPSGMVCSGGANLCLWDYSGKLLSSFDRSVLCEEDSCKLLPQLCVCDTFLFLCPQLISTLFYKWKDATLVSYRHPIAHSLVMTTPTCTCVMSWNVTQLIIAISWHAIECLLCYNTTHVHDRGVCG